MGSVEEAVYLDFDDVLIKPRISAVESRQEVDLSVPIIKDWRPIPLMSANMDTVTGAEMAYALVKRNWIAALHKFVEKNEIKTLYDRMEKEGIDFRNLFVTRGTAERDRKKLKERLEYEPRIQSVCIDVANGYREGVFSYVDRLRNGVCRDQILMVGNVATPDAVERYAKIGVDIVKCGIGPGSACITRVQTGVGVPQIGMLFELEKMASRHDVLICADGGCRRPGDIAKAFVAGADFVMLGGMLAAHNESPGEITYVSDKKVKRFSGMAAIHSQWEGVPTYGAEEGKTVFLDARGPVEETLKMIEGGLRSTCTYTNSPTLKELRDAVLIRTTVQENRIFSS